MYALLLVGVIALVLSPVWRRSGWPLNQASTAPILLIQFYADHFRHLDFFPVWSSSDGIGLGTPVMLYYHRLFFYLAGLIYAATGASLKSAIIVTLAIFLAVGAYGMRRALGVVTDRRLLTWAGSLGFLLTNYVFTDWFDQRGDLAEFSALMIVPWLLWWCLNLLKNREVSFILIPVTVLLVNAHSGIALTALFALATALVAYAACAGIAGLRAIVKRMAVSVAAVTVLLLPLFVAELRFSSTYDPQSKATPGTFRVEDQFESFGRYLYDGSHRWLASNGHEFVQIDYVLWVPLVVAALIGLGGWARTRQSPRWWRDVRTSQGPVVLFLVLGIALYLFLQLRISLFVYRLLPPLQVISFPWRMLAFITPMSLILLVVVVDGVMGHLDGRVVWGVITGIWIALLVAFSPVFSPVSYHGGFLAQSGQFPQMVLFTAPSRIDYRTFRGFFLGSAAGGLYTAFYPKVLSKDGKEMADEGGLYAQLHRHQAGAQSLSAVPCTVAEPSSAPLETLRLSLRVDCDGPTRLALPVSYNGFSTVLRVEADGTLQRIPYFRVPTDPRIVIDVRSPGPQTLIVHLPTLWGTLSSW